MNPPTEKAILEALIYKVLYKHTDSYWDENGRIKVIYAGERLPAVSDNPNQLDQLLAISDEIVEQILTEQLGESESKISNSTNCVNCAIEWARQYETDNQIAKRKIEEYHKNCKGEWVSDAGIGHIISYFEG